MDHTTGDLFGRIHDALAGLMKTKGDLLAVADCLGFFAESYGLLDDTVMAMLDGAADAQEAP